MIEQTGGFIAHWDDDDWYGPTRLADQVAALQQLGAEACGLASPFFYDLRTGEEYSYHFPNCAYGATLMYTREFWQDRPFADIQVGETDPFLANRKPVSLLASWYVGMIHDGNTCRKALQTRYFTKGTGELIQNKLAADWSFYQSLREKMGVAA